MTAQSPTPRPASRANPRWLTPALLVLIVVLVAAGFVALRLIATLPERVDDQQTVLIVPSRLAPGSTAALRVVVQDFKAGRPVAGADVSVSLQPPQGRAILLFTGQTDASGSLPVQFAVPADAPAEARIVVDTSSSAGRDHVEQAVTISRDWRLLLSSDKPLYQPGQVVHMRALALSTLDMTPARGATVDFLVEDAKGNKVFRKSVAASDYGIAACDFQLADLVNQGNYKLSVAIGETRSERTVEVRPYVLPKFAVQVTTARPFYLPGEHVEGTVQVDYFFGKPVSGAAVEIIGSVWDVERTVVVDVRGTTDERGTYAFAFDLPQYFAGSGLESGQAQFALEVTVIDQAKHAEQTSQVLPVAAQPIVIQAVAESGTLRPGLENIIYILTSFPDGRPAPASLQVQVDGGAPTTLETGEFGLAEYTFVPTGSPSLHIEAHDAAGNSAAGEFYFDLAYGGDSILLRTDRAAYVVGETMNLVAFSQVDAGSVYLDIVKAGQTLSTRAVPVQNGKAEFAIDVSPDLYGTIELHAYKVLLDGTIVRDTRLVVVDAPNDLTIAIKADKDVYKPGETASISFQTGAATGEGVRTALGLAIVDESVFALQSQDAGFAKLYFILEQALLQPRYQIKQFELPGQYKPDETALRQAQDQAARAAWAGAPATMAQEVNSRPLKQTAVAQAQQLGYLRLAQASIVAMILLPLAMLAAAVVTLAQGHVLGRALLRLVVATIIAVVGLGMVVLMLVGANNLGMNPEWILVALGLIAILGFVFFLMYAVVMRDTAGLFLVLLTAAWGASFYLVVRIIQQAVEVDQRLLIAGLAAALLIPPAYLLLGQGRWAQGNRSSGVVASGLSVALVGALLIVPLSVLGGGGSLLMGGGPMRDGGLRRLAGGVVVTDQFEAAAPGMPQPTMAPEPTSVDENKQQQGTTGVEPPRLRQYFPETLFWLPELVTDELGNASLQVPMADSITTWRLTALASSQDGRLGFNTYGLRVFQDFFVDIDLPVALTEGDEISIPVGVFNYLPTAQQVRLVVQQEPWFELLGPGEQTMTIAGSDIDVVYFPIRVKAFGRYGFQVTAWGSQMNDAIRREVDVVPNGKEVRLTESNWLKASKDVAVAIPTQAVPGTARIEVKIYPGVLAQVVEGLEKLLQVPYG
jgi:5-hydroxyisourate hydrolase-like protein (transthyretin family)/archaellum component FlaF (FlaF/FlaG flagellin family)